MANTKISALTSGTPALVDEIPAHDIDGASEALSTIRFTLQNLMDLFEANMDLAVARLSDATANGRSLISAANYAAMRTLLDLEAGTDFYSIAAADSAFEAADADILKADTADQLTAAFTGTVTDDGTKTTGTYTPTPASGGQYKKIVHGAGAFTLAPFSPASNEATTLSLLIVNASASGTITTSGFTMVTGDAFDNTGTNRFLCRIEVVDYGGTEVSSLDVVALQ